MGRKDERHGKRASVRKRTVFVFVLVVGIILGASAILFKMGTGEEHSSTIKKESTKEEARQHAEDNKKNKDEQPIPDEKKEPKEVRTSITISAAGDFTIGTDESFGYATSEATEKTSRVVDKDGISKVGLVFGITIGFSFPEFFPDDTEIRRREREKARNAN